MRAVKPFLIGPLVFFLKLCFCMKLNDIKIYTFPLKNIKNIQKILTIIEINDIIYK